MRVVLANHSSYPRVGEGPEAQRVRRAYASRERGKIDDAGYGEVVRDYVSEIVAEQQQAGCEVVTDGQVGWYDAIAHLTAPLDNVKVGDIFRFFDTNYLVRRPHVTGELSGSVGLADDFRHTASVASGTAKAVVTGPYTLARHSVVETDAYDVTSLTLAYADVLGAELAALKGAGCTLVQVEEPSLLQHPQDAGLVRQGLERAKAQGAPPISLVTFFGDAAPLYRDLRDMPAEMLGFDLTYSPRIIETLTEHGVDRPVALGVLDGRNTSIDDVAAIAKAIGPVVETADEVHLQPSCGLEYLPRDRASRKLGLLPKLRDALGGSA